MSNEHFTEVTFMRNVKEARENGYELLCAICGVGLHDDSDEHETWCPHSTFELSVDHSYNGLREELAGEFL